MSGAGFTLADPGARVVALVVPAQATQATQATQTQQAQPTQQAQTRQPSEADLRREIQQNAATIRREALENARAQLQASRAQIEAQRAQNQAGVPLPPVPLPPGNERVTVTRDGQPVVVVGGGGAGQAVGGARVFTTQTGDPNFVFRPEIPHGAVVLGVAFFIMLAFIAVGLPLARAWARRMDRQSAAPPAPYPLDVTDRLERIEHAVESIAIEVERISEGQRFTTKLLTERGEGDAVAIPAARQDPVAGGGGGR